MTCYCPARLRLLLAFHSDSARELIYLSYPRHIRIDDSNRISSADRPRTAPSALALAASSSSGVKSGSLASSRLCIVTKLCKPVTTYARSIWNATEYSGAEDLTIFHFRSESQRSSRCKYELSNAADSTTPSSLP